MHGTMFVHLRKFTEDAWGPAAWNDVLTSAGLGPRVYLPIASYPDEELSAIVLAAARATKRDVPSLLESFGEYVAPHLVAMYRHLLKPSWRTLDVLEHVEETAHRAVRIERPGATPPYLDATRTSEREITINYTSGRRLCYVAKGIIRGLSRHFGESLTIRESECMHHGGERCLLHVSVVAS